MWRQMGRTNGKNKKLTNGNFEIKNGKQNAEQENADYLAFCFPFFISQFPFVSFSLCRPGFMAIG